MSFTPLPTSLRTAFTTSTSRSKPAWASIHLKPRLDGSFIVRRAVRGQPAPEEPATPAVPEPGPGEEPEPGTDPGEG